MQGWQYGKGLIYYVIKVHPSGTTHGFVAVDLLTFYRYGISRKVVGKSARDNPERYCG